MPFGGTIADARRLQSCTGKGGSMGVTVRERPKDSGEYWVFINHKGKRKLKK